MVEEDSKTPLLDGKPHVLTDEEERASIVDIHLPTTLLVVVVSVIIFSSLDWAVLIPIEADIADFLGQSTFYGTMLISCLYIAFPVGLYIFYIPDTHPEFANGSIWRRKFIIWTVFATIGNVGFTVFLWWDPASCPAWLIAFRIIQGVSQAISVAVALITNHSCTWTTKHLYIAVIYGFSMNFGTGLGVMLCAEIVTMVGEESTWNGVPIYLVAPTAIVSLLALVVGGFVFLWFPDQLSLVSDEQRTRKKAPESITEMEERESGTAASLDTEPTTQQEHFRRKRCFVVSLIVNLIRATLRTAWLHTAEIILEDQFNFTVIVSARWYFFAVTVASSIQQVVAQYHTMFADLKWIRITELAGTVLTLSMVVGWYVAKYTDSLEWCRGAGFFLATTTMWETIMLVNANLLNLMGSNYAIAGDPLWSDGNYTLFTVLSQMMLGRILGPIVGDYFYYSHGLAGFYMMLCGGTIIGAGSSFLFMR